MPTVSTNSTNLSTKNASSFVNSIKNEDRILSFYLGSIESSNDKAFSDDRRNQSYAQASFFRKIEPSNIDIVAKKIDWSNTSFQTFNSSDDTVENFYVLHNNNVYLVIGNNKFNSTEDSGQIRATIQPTHTDGVVKYSDGYEYLYLFTLSADSKVVTSSKLWMPVPDNDLVNYKGRLFYKKINVKSLESVSISHKNPEIPILSDSGSSAKIKLLTQNLSSPTVTASNRKYKIVGIEVTNIGTSPYVDFNLNESLSRILTKESSSTISQIESAITLGFSSNENFNVRNVLKCSNALITVVSNSSEIKSVVGQNKFKSFGIVEGIKNDSNEQIFTKNGTTKIVSNNVKVTTGSYSLGPNPNTTDFAEKTTLTLTNKTKNKKGKVVFSELSGGSNLIAEVETLDKNEYEVSDTIKSDATNQVFEITAVDKPVTKEFSGNVLHIGDVDFSFDDTDGTGVKTFVTQVIQKF